MSTAFAKHAEHVTMLLQRALDDGRFAVTNSSRRDIQKGTTFMDVYAERGTLELGGQVVVRERVQGPDVELRLADVEFFGRRIESVPCGHHAGAGFDGTGAEALRAFLDAHPPPWLVSLASASAEFTATPSICERIVEARGGDLIVRIEDTHAATPLDAARLFGLFDAAVIYNEVSREEAKAVLVAVLVKDMAYGTPLVPPDEAAELADVFLRSLAGDQVRYFTNGEFGKPRSHPNVGPSWSPATEYTFDSGVLVLTERRVGCAWFMDED